jgi:hypothetical protein
MNTFVRIGRYVLDVSISEEHTFEADVTDYPVESGGNISDNIRVKPVKIKIEGIVSDTPLSSNANNSPIILGNPYEPGVDKFATDTNALLAKVRFLRSEEAYGYLKWIWENKEIVQLFTSLGTFNDMAMQSFNVPRSKETTGGLKFTATFQQIKKITNTRIRDKVSIRNGGKHRNRGGQSGKDWFVNEVTWRKANPPGSKNIYATEQVRWYWKPSLAGGGNTVTAHSTDNAVNSKVTSANVLENHQWYHWSGPKGVPSPQPLTPDELRAFNLDYSRDKIDRLVLGNDAVKLGFTRDQDTPIGVTSKAYYPKKGDADMSAAMQRSIAKDVPGASGDPTFQNKGNYQRPQPWNANKWLTDKLPKVK